MKGIAFLSGFITFFLISGIILPASSQVTSDGTTDTKINKSGNNFNILNGIPKENNLFHSFKEFSIPKGGSATFENSANVVNIINRVTGGNISNIDGLIKAQGSANLFLINPAGIVFGENASLDIGGSFLGSTAESILFEDGFEFSAVNPQNQPLLTISVPVGLQMGINPGDIQVNGNGQFIIDNQDLTFLSPAVQLPALANLEVTSGKTLALIGGNVTLKGSSLRANQGRIELGGANNGIVDLQPSLTGWNLDYTEVSTDKDISLESQSAIDVSGLTSQGIQLVGRQVKLKDGSIALMQVFGTAPTSGITVKAKELVEVTGTNSTSLIPSSITIENLGFGTTGDLVIYSANLAIREGGGIGSSVFGSNVGANVDLNIYDEVIVSGSSPINSFRFSRLGSQTLGTGNGGNVNLSTRKLTVENGANIGSVALFGTGTGGDVIINNAESIEVIGEGLHFSSSINTSTLSQGNAGRLAINTAKLTLRNGGDIDSTTLSAGNAGEIKINATEFIKVTTPDTDSNIRSAGFDNSLLIKALGLPQILSGNGGTIGINTPSLELTGNTSVSVANDGTGIAGNLEINTDTIFLSDNAAIEASTASGKGGNITLNVSDFVVLRNGSKISATAGGTGNGGSLDIQAPFIVSVPQENSDITANAKIGNGGNIQIKTKGIFGLQYRDNLTEESDITASSEFGINGTVEINNLGIDPSSGLIELPVKLSDSSQQISTGCLSTTDSNFIVTGRGGIPRNPNHYLISNQSWFDTSNLSLSHRTTNDTTATVNISTQSAIIEATGFIRNQDGEIELVAAENKPVLISQTSDCSGNNT
ncbi:MAG: filamentous hemagglutinin N-terminal domain-containing protein [Rivularia sp. (in: Bacteria)]|nr:filamentous hemagglutinin N-terminal domain-containing protein [Rivularia sp. MS3]